MADRCRLLIVCRRPVAHAGLAQLIEQLRKAGRRPLWQIDPAQRADVAVAFQQT